MNVWSCCGYSHEPHPRDVEYWLEQRRLFNGVKLQLVPLCRTPEAAKDLYARLREPGAPAHLYPIPIRLERVA